MRPISGVGARAPWEARRAPGRGGAPTGDDLALVAHLQAAVGVFQDFHLHTGVAGTLGAGQELQGAPLVLDRVVPGHLAGVLEAEDFIQRPISVPGTIGRIGQFSRYGKPEVVAAQQVPQHGIGLVDGAGASQTQFGH